MQDKLLMILGVVCSEQRICPVGNWGGRARQ